MVVVFRKEALEQMGSLTRSDSRRRTQVQQAVKMDGYKYSIGGTLGT